MLSPPVTLTLLRKPTTAENYCTALRSVRIIFFFFLSLSFPSFFLRPAILRTPPSPSLHFRVRSPFAGNANVQNRRGERKRESAYDCGRFRAKIRNFINQLSKISNFINAGALAVLDSVPKKRTLASSCGRVSNYERYPPSSEGFQGRSHACPGGDAGARSGGGVYKSMLHVPSRNLGLGQANGRTKKRTSFSKYV